jgi:hypothetical protein
MMSHNNPLWGAARIHGELLKLGVAITEPHRYCSGPEREFPVPITLQVVVDRREDESVAVLRQTFSYL